MGAGPSKPNIVNGKQVLRVHFDRREVVTEAHEAYEALELDLRRVLTIPDGHQVVMSAYLEFSQGRQVEVDPKLWSALRPQIGEAWITTKPAAEEMKVNSQVLHPNQTIPSRWVVMIGPVPLLLLIRERRGRKRGSRRETTQTERREVTAIPVKGPLALTLFVTADLKELRISRTLREARIKIARSGSVVRVRLESAAALETKTNADPNHNTYERLRIREMGAGSSKPIIVNGVQMLKVHYGHRSVVTNVPETYKALELDIRQLLGDIPDGHEITMSALLDFSPRQLVEIDPKIWHVLRSQIGEVWITTRLMTEGKPISDRSDINISPGSGDAPSSSPPPYSGQRKKAMGDNVGGKA
ncbi:hypothetical protein FRC17_001637 [Serendipita sp. 399]|nr:hypothetical protein FRC17_001637 [Serendipita sp. 399]